MFILTLNRIFDLLAHLRPLQIQTKMKTKVQNLIKMLPAEKIVMHP